MNLHSIIFCIVLFFRYNFKNASINQLFSEIANQFAIFIVEKKFSLTQGSFIIMNMNIVEIESDILSCLNLKGLELKIIENPKSVKKSSSVATTSMWIK